MSRTVQDIRHRFAGASVVVDAGRVQQMIAPHDWALRLVVLAACNSGADGEPGNHLGSIAQMIHRAGLRAVVASRFPLSTAGSSRFCGALFAALAGPGTSLERAFVALITEHGYRRYHQTEFVGETMDFERYHGPETWARLHALRAELDPAGVLNRGGLGLSRREPVVGAR